MGAAVGRDNAVMGAWHCGLIYEAISCSALQDMASNFFLDKLPLFNISLNGYY